MTGWDTANPMLSYIGPNAGLGYMYVSFATIETLQIDRIRFQAQTNSGSQGGAQVPVNVWIASGPLPIANAPVAPNGSTLGYTNVGTVNVGNFSQFGNQAVKTVSTNLTLGPGSYTILLVPSFQIDGYMQFDDVALIGKVTSY